MNEIEAKKHIVETAQKMLDGDIHLIIGCRIITGLSCRTENSNDKIFNTFLALDSETDHLPLTVSPDLCDPEYLKRVYKESDRYLSLASDDIKNACRAIINRFKPSEGENYES